MSQPTLQLAVIIFWLTIFGIISWKRKDWGLFLTIFLLPSYLVRFKIAGIPTTVLEVMIYILFAVWLIFPSPTAVSPSPEGRGRKRGGGVKEILSHNHILCSAVLLLILGVTLSTIFSSDLLTSFGIAKGWFFDPFLVFILITALSRNHPRLPSALLKALAFSGIAVASISLIHAIFGKLTFDERLRAFFLSPNHLAMYLAPSLIAYLYLFQPSSKKTDIALLRNKLRNLLRNSFSQPRLDFNYLLKVSGGLIITTSLFLTYSYGAWIAVIIATLWLLTKNSPLLSNGDKLGCDKKNKLLYCYIAILLIGLGLIVGSQIDNPKLENIFETQRSSLHSRVMIWQASIKILKDHWLLGIGPGMFQKYYLSYQKYFPPYLEWAVPQPHNIFLAFWLQTGLIGFIGFIGIIFWFFHSYIRIGPHKKIATITMAIMLYTLLHGLVDTPYWKNDLSIVFWVIVAIMLTLKSQKINRKLPI